MSDLKIEGFEILGLIGKGGMASVWKARQISLDRIVAIKIMSTHLSKDPSDVQRFQSEAQSAAKLKHQGIVQVYDASITDGMYYFVMEFVDGYTVTDWLRRKNILPEEDILLVAECVVDALDYAWKKEKIIHCDIKPDNIMVDADGTVKVADLGLARTMSAMSSEAVTDEVMGTPAYMSPEQALGKMDMDCRTDIYSLGASIYHLATGRTLFSGKPDGDVMEMQVSSADKDPMEVNPQLSRGICWMMEKMLAKNVDDRYEDWEEVSRDIARVKRKHMPHGGHFPSGISTISRSSKRTNADFIRDKGPRVQGRKSNPFIVIAGLLAMSALAAGVYYKFVHQPSQVTRNDPDPIVETNTVPPVVIDNVKPDPVERENAAREAYETAKAWVSEHSDEFDKCVQCFAGIRGAVANTSYARIVEDDIAGIRNAKKRAVDEVMAGLAEATAYDAANGRFIAVAETYESYSGPHAGETQNQRTEKASQFRAKHENALKEQREREARIKQKTSDALDHMAVALLDGGLPSGMEVMLKVLSDEELNPLPDDLMAVRRLLESAVKMDDKILDSFRENAGETITIYFTAGAKQLSVLGVKDGKVRAKQIISAGGGNVMMDVNFGVDDLAPREKLQRMGSDSHHDVALVKGLMAYHSKAMTHAKRYFEHTLPVLAKRLLAFMGETSSLRTEPEAAVDMASTAPTVEPEPPKAVDKKEARKVSVSEVQKEFAAKNSGVFPDQVRVQASDDGKIIGLKVVSTRVVNMSSLTGLTDLESVQCSAIEPDHWWERNRVSALDDISALEGIPLKRLILCNTSIKDISILKGMPLKDLNVSGTAVSDIGVLRGMSLEKLSVGGTSVRDISVLRGMPITTLDVRNTKVTDLITIKNLPLVSLDISGTSIRDTSLLSQVPLEYLDLSDTRIFDCRPLTKLKLKHLKISGTQIKDVSFAKDIASLELFAFERTNVSDIKALEKTGIVSLYMGETRVTDISPLAGSAVKRLSIYKCKISDLAALKELELEELNISGTDVTDLKQLIGVSVKHLEIRETKIKDYSPLLEMKVTSIVVDDDNTKIRSFLRRMPALERINWGDKEKWF